MPWTPEAKARNKLRRLFKSKPFERALRKMEHNLSIVRCLCGGELNDGVKSSMEYNGINRINEVKNNIDTLDINGLMNGISMVEMYIRFFDE